MSRGSFIAIYALLAASAMPAAELKQETLDAWDRYIHRGRGRYGSSRERTLSSGPTNRPNDARGSAAAK